MPSLQQGDGTQVGQVYDDDEWLEPLHTVQVTGRVAVSTIELPLQEYTVGDDTEETRAVKNLVIRNVTHAGRSVPSAIDRVLESHSSLTGRSFVNNARAVNAIIRKLNMAYAGNIHGVKHGITGDSAIDVPIASRTPNFIHRAEQLGYNPYTRHTTPAIGFLPRIAGYESTLLDGAELEVSYSSFKHDGPVSIVLRRSATPIHEEDKGYLHMFAWAGSKFIKETDSGGYDTITVYTTRKGPSPVAESGHARESKTQAASAVLGELRNGLKLKLYPDDTIFSTGASITKVYVPLDMGESGLDTRDVTIKVLHGGAGFVATAKISVVGGELMADVSEGLVITYLSIGGAEGSSSVRGLPRVLAMPTARRWNVDAGFTDFNVYHDGTLTKDEKAELTANLITRNAWTGFQRRYRDVYYYSTGSDVVEIEGTGAEASTVDLYSQNASEVIDGIGVDLPPDNNIVKLCNIEYGRVMRGAGMVPGDTLDKWDEAPKFLRKHSNHFIRKVSELLIRHGLFYGPSGEAASYGASNYDQSIYVEVRTRDVLSMVLNLFRFDGFGRDAGGTSDQIHRVKVLDAFTGGGHDSMLRSLIMPQVRRILINLLNGAAIYDEYEVVFSGATFEPIVQLARFGLSLTYYTTMQRHALTAVIPKRIRIAMAVPLSLTDEGLIVYSPITSSLGWFKHHLSHQENDMLEPLRKGRDDEVTSSVRLGTVRAKMIKLDSRSHDMLPIVEIDATLYSLKDISYDMLGVLLNILHRQGKRNAQISGIIYTPYFVLAGYVGKVGRKYDIELYMEPAPRVSQVLQSSRNEKYLTRASGGPIEYAAMVSRGGMHGYMRALLEK